MLVGLVWVSELRRRSTLECSFEWEKATWMNGKMHVQVFIQGIDSGSEWISVQ